MLLLSPPRYFFCRRKGGSSTVSTEDRCAEPSDSQSIASSDSQRSAILPSLRIHTLFFRDKFPCQFTPPTATFDAGHSCESGSETDVDEALRYFSSSDSDTTSCTSSPSSWTPELPHDCQCTSRSICPDFLKQHFALVQIHERRCLSGALLMAYHVCVDNYAQACEAVSLPTAKLKRAKAEYEWLQRRQADDARLLAPRVQVQLAAVQIKLSAAEKDWEQVNEKRRMKAQSLMDIGRF